MYVSVCRVELEWSDGAVSTAVRTGYQPPSACRQRRKIEKGGGEGERDWGISGFWSKRAVDVNLKTDPAKLYRLFELGKGQSKFQNNPFNKLNFLFNKLFPVQFHL